VRSEKAPAQATPQHIIKNDTNRPALANSANCLRMSVSASEAEIRRARNFAIAAIRDPIRFCAPTVRKVSSERPRFNGVAYLEKASGLIRPTLSFR
jgi:hypothetical protein